MMLGYAQLILVWLMLLLTLWAFVDCLMRPGPAFPAVDRQTKVAWLIFIGLAGLFIYIGGLFLGLLSMVLVVYYFVDVRAKIIEITGNRSR